MGNILIVPLLAAFAVFPLWLVESVLPWPWLVEEVFKLWLIWQLKEQNKTSSHLLVLLLTGIAFWLSETVLLSFNMVQAGLVGSLKSRVLMTLPMHLLTFLVLYWGTSRGRILTFVALIVAVLIHFGFNESLGLMN